MDNIDMSKAKIGEMVRFNTPPNVKIPLSSENLKIKNDDGSEVGISIIQVIPGEYKNIVEAKITSIEIV